MKVFQIAAGTCYWDATNKFPDISATVGKFPPNILFVEAPDYVFEGWGYDPNAEGDARFIRPTPPDGWLYDADTGTFYQEGTVAPSSVPTAEEQLRADVDFIAAMMGVTL